MWFKKTLLRIALAAGFIAVFLIIRYQGEIRNALLSGADKAKAYSDNFLSDSQGETKRRRPISLAERETELKLYIGDPFRSFTSAEWDDFWDLVFGEFPRESSGPGALLQGMRQLNTDEIAFELMSRYPTPFAYFKDSHWKIIFGIIFKK